MNSPGVFSAAFAGMICMGSSRGFRRRLTGAAVKLRRRWRKFVRRRSSLFESSRRPGCDRGPKGQIDKFGGDRKPATAYFVKRTFKVVGKGGERMKPNMAPEPLMV